MNNFIFYSPTEFVFGRDTEAQTGALVQKYGARKVMIVYGGGSVIRSGLLARVEKSLQEVGIPYCMLGGVQPNPIDTKVYEGIDLCRKESVDMMLAVGGGPPRSQQTFRQKKAVHFVPASFQHYEFHKYR